MSLSDRSTPGGAHVSGAIAVALAVIAALALRYSVIEPQALSHACQAGTAWWCLPRQLLIDALHANALGALGVVSAGVAMLTASRRFGAITTAIAAAGLVLYNFDWAAVSLLAGLSVWFAAREHNNPH